MGLVGEAMSRAVEDALALLFSSQPQPPAAETRGPRLAHLESRLVSPNAQSSWLELDQVDVLFPGHTQPRKFVGRFRVRA